MQRVWTKNDLFHCFCTELKMKHVNWMNAFSLVMLIDLATTTTSTAKPTRWSTTTLKPFSTSSPPTQKPVTWWSSSSTSSTSKPSWWSTTSTKPTANWPKPPSTPSPSGVWIQWTNPIITTTKRPVEISDDTGKYLRPIEMNWTQIQTPNEHSFELDPQERPSSTTPSWWHPPPTPQHKPGNFAPEKVPLVYPNELGNLKPTTQQPTKVTFYMKIPFFSSRKVVWNHLHFQ